MARRAAMSRGIKSSLPFGVSAPFDNQRDYIKAISHVTRDTPRDVTAHSQIKRKLYAVDARQLAIYLTCEIIFVFYLDKCSIVKTEIVQAFLYVFIIYAKFCKTV